MRVLNVFGQLWALGRKVEEPLSLQQKTREALEAVDSRLRMLENRMTHLEAHEEQLVTEARAAAGAASTALAGAVISDVVTRLTRIEEAANHQPPLKKRLSPPKKRPSPPKKRPSPPNTP